MAISRIDIVSIPVRDQDRSKRFYTETLGFEVLRDSPLGQTERWVQLGLPGAETSIALVTWFDRMPAGCVQGLVLHTDDVDHAAAALQAKGLAISAVTDAPWGRYCTFEDPDGNGWVLQQTGPEEMAAG
jgi:catechol 2,3-dioxygenase-like lactoylglutathione lyase family enzyme